MVGLNVQEPETTCDDPNCPFHGTLPVRGQVLEGVFCLINNNSV